MKIIPLISIALMLIGSTLLSAQCDHLQIDNSGSSCETATFLCPWDLHLHTGTLSDTMNQNGPMPLCGTNTQADNIKWYRFAVCEPYVELLITPSNCTTVFTNGFPQTGLQAGIYSDCDYTDALACDANDNTAPFTLSGNDFEPGSMVYLFLDGMAGSVCDYQIEIIAGIDTSTVTFESDSLAVAEDGMVMGDDPAPCTQSAYPYYFTLPTCVGEGKAPACSFNGNTQEILTCYEWVITPDTGFVFIGDSTAANINIQWIIPGTYTIDVVIHTDQALGGCGTGAFECGELIPLTVNVSAPFIDYLPPVYVCEGDDYFFCGQYYFQNSLAICIIDACYMQYQEINFIPPTYFDLGTQELCEPNECFEFQGIPYCVPGFYSVQDNTAQCEEYYEFEIILLPPTYTDLGQIEVCAPSSCFELQGVMYCDPGVYTVLDTSTQCEAYYNFEIILKTTTTNNIGSQYVCSGTACFTLFGNEYCNTGSYSVQDPNISCPTFTEFEIIDLLTLPLNLTVSNDHIDCINTNAIIEAQFDSNGYSGTIDYAWIDPTGTSVAQGPSLSASYGGVYTCLLTFPDLSQSCALNASTMITENTEEVIVELSYEELNCGTTVTVVQYTANQNITTHFWEGQNGFSSSSANPTITEGGNYQGTFIAENGCQISMQFEVEESLELPVANFNDYENWKCNTTTMMLELELPANHLTVSWESSDGVIDNITKEQIEVSQPGTYTATIMDPDTQCEFVTSATIVNDPDILLDFEFTSTDVFCQDVDDGYISIDNIIGGTGPFTSSINGTLSESLDFDLLAPGTYEIVLADANGCVITQSVEILAYPELIIDAPEEIEVTQATNHTYSIDISDPSRVESISWMDHNGVQVGEGETITYLAMEDTQLTVEVIDSYGCKISTQLIINIRLSDQVYVPNVFSPNADGVNDFFTLFSIPSPGKIEALSIYDRWGNLVYLAEDFDLNEETQGWDGNFDGKPLPNAVYVYQATVNNGKDQLENYKGSVTLIR